VPKLPQTGGHEDDVTTAAATRLRTRIVFISDIHLGTRGCQAELLLDFLDSVDTEVLILVGDIVDWWSLRRRLYWPAAHQAVLARFMQLAAAGTRVIYVPGNHDEAARAFCGLTLGRIDVQRELVHETASGQRLLVLHGDEFDGSIEFSGWLKQFGSFMYDLMLVAGRAVHFLRRRLGHPYWSLAAWLKQAVPNAKEYIARFEAAAIQEAARRGLDGVVCGHIHHPQLREAGGRVYCNDGDWVEHCTALIEDRGGRLALLPWADFAWTRRSAAPPRTVLDRERLRVVDGPRSAVAAGGPAKRRYRLPGSARADRAICD
jgi:UDP-2,3-diacylglucosamine pyrophosphatase LpxH